MSAPTVLVIGFDPRAIPGVDAAMVETALEHGQARFEGIGVEADLCLVALDEYAEPAIVEALRRRPYDCVVVGGGIRKPEALLELFERVVNLIRTHAPGAAIGFNTNAADSADAVVRCLELG